MSLEFLPALEGFTEAALDGAPEKLLAPRLLVALIALVPAADEAFDGEAALNVDAAFDEAIEPAPDTPETPETPEAPEKTLPPKLLVPVVPEKTLGLVEYAELAVLPGMQEVLGAALKVDCPPKVEPL